MKRFQSHRMVQLCHIITQGHSGCSEAGFFQRLSLGLSVDLALGSLRLSNMGRSMQM